MAERRLSRSHLPAEAENEDQEVLEGANPERQVSGTTGNRKVLQG